MSEDIIGDEIREHMARAFFASAYADQAEECGQSLSGEIMDQLPDDIDSAAIHAATTLAFDTVRANGLKSIAELLAKIAAIQEVSESSGDRPLTPEMLGHYLAMQAMACGVDIGDAFGQAVYDAIRVPYLEFDSYSLERDYFKSQSDD